jgi:DNA-binding HxlR family transcriptional regulator
MKRTSLKKAACPVARSLDAIGDWWSLLIIRDALDGISRFGQFQESLGISRCTLTVRLKNLVSLGILGMAPLAEHSAHREYYLTQKGRDLFSIIVSLRQWGEDHCYDKGEKHSILIDKITRQRVKRLELRSQNGRKLSPSAVTVHKAASTNNKRSFQPAHRPSHVSVRY